jgi:carbon-monoxide dehydrogenase medium subunit
MVHIGAATTHATVAAKAQSYPGLAKLAAHIGDPAVRNRGTIGGSLANNDPAACYPAAALASQIHERLRRMITFRVCSVQRWAKVKS